MKQDRFLLKPGAAVRLSNHDASSTEGVRDKEHAQKLLEANVKRLGALQYRLWAERERSVLVVLQGMDTAGKDGVIRHVMTGMNPSGCRVTSFKKPSEEEAQRDFLWRIHKAVPAKGEVGVFNRSHYEDVLIVRVNHLIPEPAWRARYDEINQFEDLLTRGGTTIVKCYLHISKDEQKRRLIARLEDPDKNWKFNPGDIEERRRWTKYMAAYQDALKLCGTNSAPWRLIPSDKKWYRDWAVSEVLLQTLEKMDPQPPKGTLKRGDFFIE